jgi:multidrug efflux pump subunit AcrB
LHWRGVDDAIVDVENIVRRSAAFVGAEAISTVTLSGFIEVLGPLFTLVD